MLRTWLRCGNWRPTTFTRSMWLGCTGAERQKFRKLMRRFFDLLFKDRSCRLAEIESIDTLPGGASLRLPGGRWGTIDGRMGK
jgi:hypothetical protein